MRKGVRSTSVSMEGLRSAGWTVTPPRGRRCELASFREVARVLEVSIDWVRTHRGEIGRVIELPGGVLRFRWSDVEGALERWSAIEDSGRPRVFSLKP